MLRLLEELLKGVGVCRVAGLGAFGLGHREFVEEHHLQLLRRTEVDLLADHLERLVRCSADLRRELGLQFTQKGRVDCDADPLHLRQEIDQRQLDVGEQLRTTVSRNRLIEGLGQIEHGAGLQHQTPPVVAVDGVEAELAGVSQGLLQLSLEVAHSQVSQVVGTLIGTHEVGRERGVADQALQRPAVGVKRLHRTLGVVHDLGSLWIGTPGRQRIGVHRGDGVGVDPGRRTVCSGESHRPHLTGPGAPTTSNRHTGAGSNPRRACAGHRSVSFEPLGQFTRPQVLTDQVEGLVDRFVDDLKGLEESLAQHPELQPVEQRVHLVSVPRPHDQVLGAHVEIQVAHEMIEVAVADDVPEVGAQALAGLARYLVGPGDHIVEAVVLLDPLGCRLGTDAGHAGEVVGVLPHERGQLGVAAGRQAVLGLDRGRRHPGQFRHSPHGIEHCRAVGDQLERVAVSGEDQHLQPVIERPVGPGGDDVVGLVALLRHERDPQRAQDLLDQRQLTLELLRGLVALGLVFGVLRQPEGLPGQVEGHPDVSRLLVAEHVDEHGGEAVDSVRRLPGGGAEVLHGQREERSVGQGVPVEKEQSRANRSGRRVGHTVTLAFSTDAGRCERLCS